MKKSTIWLLTILMVVTFIGLLFIEIKYMEDIIKMRDDHFAESVHISLSSVSDGLEEEEIRYYENVVRDVESAAVYSQYSDGQLPHLGGISYSFNTFSGIEGSLTILGDVDQIAKLRTDEPELFDRKNDFDEAQARLDDRYRYHQGVLDEVILKTLTQADNRPTIERVDSTYTRKLLTEALSNNGVNIPFCFAIVNNNGIPVYTTEGFPNVVEPEDDTMFTQGLFPYDPVNKKIFLKVYFPSKEKYILKSVRFLIPAFIFTVILLFVFVYVIILAFRQKKLNEMKTDFINNMTHEFKTPISTISLAAQMLNDDSVRKSPAMLQHISTVINDETKRLRFQVEKVLQMSMFDRKKATVRLQEVDANATIDNIVHNFKIKVEKYGGKLNAMLDAEDSIVNVDEMHFTNVIYNLLDNAVKYRCEDRPLNITVTTTNISNSRLEITIADNGIGIKKEHLRKIFEKFYRVPTGNQHDVKGFGLGLAYVYKMIYVLGGTIKAESEINQGTKFIIILPLIKN